VRGIPWIEPGEGFLPEDLVLAEQACNVRAEHNRWEFILNIAPLRQGYVTGSPVNPIAIF
jgi:hypothetical protein